MKSKYLGQFSVDSGHIVIVDPCYINEGTGPTKEFYNKSVYAAQDDGGMIDPTNIDPNGICGRAVSVLTGDGVYPVYADYNDDGHINSLYIDLSLPSGKPDDSEDVKQNIKKIRKSKTYWNNIDTNANNMIVEFYDKLHTLPREEVVDTVYFFWSHITRLLHKNGLSPDEVAAEAKEIMEETLKDFNENGE